MFSSSLKKDNKIQSVQITSSALIEIGSILKQARERNRYSLKDIRDKTCIPIHHIIAIESADRKKLPEDLFLLGFIKRYAKTVGLSEQALCDKYLNLKENKLKNLNHETEAFDLLFQEHEKDNFKLSLENRYLKGYHFYIFIALILFLTAAYFVFRKIEAVSSSLTPSLNLTYEKNESNEVGAPNIDFDKVESWVSNEATVSKPAKPKTIPPKTKPEIKKNIIVKKSTIPITTKKVSAVKPLAQAQEKTTVVKKSDVVNIRGEEIKLRPLRVAY